MIHCMRVSQQPQHAQGLVEGRHQPRAAEVVGGDEAIVAARKDAHTGPHPKGGRHVGDHLLLGQHPEVVTPFKKDLHQVCSGGTTGSKQGIQPGTPGRILEITWGPR
jgi:hypothetical protein